MNRNCIKCQTIIPEKRLIALPNTATCVNCSTTSAYKAVTITCGEGEDTWQETKIMSESEYDAYMKIERKTNEISGIPTILDFDDEFLDDSDLDYSSLDVE